jgi:GNAT superfamily N-acetyltransferase
MGCWEKLAWDTDFFSIPIGRITASVLDADAVTAILADAQEQGIRCLYFEADPNDLVTVLSVEKNGFHLVDVRVVLEYPFIDRPAPSLVYPVSSDLFITMARESDISRLEGISVEVGQFSRYGFDENFTPGENKRLYQVWIKNSLSGFADAVFVARWGGEDRDAIGLITCTARSGISHIQLAGVHHEHRQKGVGTGLVQAALDWARDLGMEKMQVVTQARNIPAQRLYQQMGFFTKSMSLFYHKWL